MKRWAIHAAAGAAGWMLARVADVLLGKPDDYDPWPPTSRQDCSSCGPGGVCLCSQRRGAGWRFR